MKKRNKKNLALLLIGASALGSGSIMLSNAHSAKAIIGKTYKSPAVKSPSVTFKTSTFKPVNTSRVLGGSKASINTGVTTSNGSSYQGTPKNSSLVKNNTSTGSYLNKQNSQVNTSRVLGGSKASINTGVTTSNGSSYQGTPKNSSLVKNDSSTGSYLNKQGSQVNTSRVLGGSKASINTGATTSNGSSYQDTPKTSSLVNNNQKTLSSTNKNTLSTVKSESQTNNTQGSTSSLKSKGTLTNKNQDKVVTTQGFYRK